MPFPDCQGCVLRIHHAEDAGTFGTGFVVHVTPGAGATSVVFLATCAHVMEGWRDKMTVLGRPAVLVGEGSRNAVDLAVVKVELDQSDCRSLPMVATNRLLKELLTEGQTSIRIMPARSSVLLSVREFSAEAFYRGRDVNLDCAGSIFCAAIRSGVQRGVGATERKVSPSNFMFTAAGV